MAGLRLLRATLMRPSLRSPVLLAARPSFRQNLPKSFSTSQYHAMFTTELSEAEVSALKVDKERLAKDLHHSCQWGYGIRWGK